jgi:hypothetical protein
MRLRDREFQRRQQRPSRVTASLLTSLPKEKYEIVRTAFVHVALRFRSAFNDISETTRC